MIDHRFVNEAIKSVFEKSKSLVLIATSLRDRLPVEIRKQLEIHTKKMAQKDIVDQLRPFFGDTFREFTKGRRKYIGPNISNEELIVEKLKRAPAISSKKLKNSLPLKPGEYLDAVNNLFNKGVIRCNGIYKDHVVASIELVQHAFDRTDTRFESFVDPESHEERLKQFKETYLSIGGGRPYVYIHKIRKQLGWKSELFDQTLEDLAKRKIIVLQGGDPNHLSENEVKASYKDRFGYLRLTVSWRKD